MYFRFRLKSLFPKQGSLKGCFRNMKAQNSHIDLKRMSSSGVSFGCNSDLLVGKGSSCPLLDPPATVEIRPKDDKTIFAPPWSGGSAFMFQEDLVMFNCFLST